MSASPGFDLKLLDDPLFRPLYVDNGTDQWQLQLLIPDARCAACLTRLENTALQFNGVQSARLNLGEKILTVKGTEPIDLAPLAHKLTLLGYQVTPLKIDSTEDPWKKTFRHQLIKVAVAGFCAGNIMLLSIAQYVGADLSEFNLFFGWLSFVLFLPILFFSATTFFYQFFQRLKLLQLSIDSPVVLALVIGSGLSLKNLIYRSGETYFDSLGALIFLLLAARLWQSALQRKLSQPFKHLAFLNIVSGTKWDEKNKKYLTVPVNQLQKGDQIRIYQNERLPADGILLNTIQEIDASLWTGESLPQIVHPGELLFAGTTVISDFADIQITAETAESRLSKMIREIETKRSQTTPYQSFIDKVGQGFTFIVLGVAALFVIFYWSTNPFVAVERALALSLLACPCALAIATPLALSRGLQWAQQDGFIIKEGSTLEKLAKIKQVFLDKTGTLTLGQSTVIQTIPQKIDPQILQILKELECRSQHPHAKAIMRFVNQFPVSSEKIPVTHWQETPSVGVSAHIFECNYSLKATTPPPEESAPSLTWIGLFQSPLQTMGSFSQENLPSVLENKDSVKIKELLKISLQDTVRPEAKSIVANLLNQGLNTFIVTGDRRSVAHDLGCQLGLNPKNIFAECSPEQKQNIVGQYSSTLFVGDGVNDTLAMAKAQVSIAVSGAMEASLKVCDIYIADPNLNSLINILHLSTHTMKLIRRNFIVALIYNLSGGFLALSGFIHPVLAALLMPLSSATLVGLTILSSPPFLKKQSSSANPNHEKSRIHL
ncbi:MAG: cation-translocating P-type ATPase [Bdellovibrionales bacterium]|nr:cation-translocating P-type ATPase [Bdellovibrionales bacterium]